MSSRLSALFVAASALALASTSTSPGDQRITASRPW